MENHFTFAKKELKSEKTKINTSRLNYVEREKFEKQKLEIFVKLIRDLRNKYSGLIRDRKINISYFTQEARNLISSDFNFNNPDYKSFFIKVEKAFVKRISKSSVKNRDNLLNVRDIDIVSEQCDQATLFDYIPEGKTRRVFLRLTFNK